MPDFGLTLGTAILSAAGAAEAGTGIAGLGTAATSTFFGISAASGVGTATILGASIGLSYALRDSPSVPKPEDGSIPLKQAIPPRQRGYWDCRLAGYYMLFENGNRDLQDVMAFHHGRVELIQHVYLHDQEVSVVPDISGGGIGTIQTVGSDQFGGGRLQVDFKLGDASQTASTLLTSDANINGIWTTSYKGNGIAYGVLKCGAVANPELFSRTYTNGLPLMSAVARCTPVWDPRDEDQDEHNELTWVASPNPVLQLIDYLTCVDGGMGHDRVTILPDEILALWMLEADLCAEVNPTTGAPRYQCAGWYQFDNDPEEIQNKILATCDGWMAEAGDGTLSLTVGVYREPTDDPIEDRHIFGFTINHGAADEQAINQLDVTFTDPSQKYVQQPTYPVRDEASIAATQVRAKPLDLSWVQSAAQAGYLGERALLRLNPEKTGSIVTSLYGLRYLGKRWVKLQYSVVNGLQDVVIEIQDAVVNILGGRVTFNFNTVNPVALAILEIPTNLMDFSKPRNSQYLALFEDI